MKVDHEHFKTCVHSESFLQVLLGDFLERVLMQNEGKEQEREGTGTQGREEATREQGGKPRGVQWAGARARPSKRMEHSGNEASGVRTT